MSIDIVDITPDTEFLSLLLADYYICNSCSIVDRNPDRMRVGFRCPNCCTSNYYSAVFYLPMQVRSLIDLMQEFYHLGSDAHH